MLPLPMIMQSWRGGRYLPDPLKFEPFALNLGKGFVKLSTNGN